MRWAEEGHARRTDRSSLLQCATLHSCGAPVFDHGFRQFFSQPHQIIPHLQLRRPPLGPELLQLALQVTSQHIHASVVPDTPAGDPVQGELGIADLGMDFVDKPLVQLSPDFYLLAYLSDGALCGFNSVLKVAVNIK